MAHGFKRVVARAMGATRRTRELRGWLRLRHRGYLAERGWYRSVGTETSVDADGAPLAWYTYGAIEFLEPRVRKDMDVFEYGCGNSTLWWASRVNRVWAVEHDETWYEQMRNQLPENASLAYEANTEDDVYVTAARVPGVLFDVVVVDGRNRVQCARASIGVLKPTGVILWDNSERNGYAGGISWLLDQGFRQLEFSGIAPINFHGTCTSIFYRSNNCFGI